MSLAVAALAAQLFTASSSQANSTASQPIVIQLGEAPVSWGVIDGLMHAQEAQDDHQWHVEHVEHEHHEETLQEAVQQRPSLPMPPWNAVSSSPSGYVPSTAGSGPSGGNHVSTAGDSAYEACVIAAESGGNPDIWNPSGHWGLFQFSDSTWVGDGGAPGLFGNASASYQEGIYQNVADQGAQALYDTWGAYDGCGYPAS